jgi:hypothetical protein
VVLNPDFVGIYKSGDRDRLGALIEVLREAGIVAVVLPSGRSIGMWEIEVSTDDVEVARAIIEGVRVP